MQQLQLWPIASVVVILIAVVEVDRRQVAAIKCYVCQSNVDPKCADPFDNLTLPITDCDAYPRADLAVKSELDVAEKGLFSMFTQTAPVKPVRATMCRKTRQKVNGEWRTIRGCGYLGPPGDLPLSQQDTSTHCQARHGAYDVFVENCVCNNKDGCNGAQDGETISKTLLILTCLFSMTTFLAARSCNQIEMSS